MIDGNATDVFGLSTYPIDNSLYKNLEEIERLKALSRKKYTRKKEYVENDIKDSITTNIENLKQEEEKNKTKQQEVKQELENPNLNEDLQDIFE